MSTSGLRATTRRRSVPEPYAPRRCISLSRLRGPHPTRRRHSIHSCPTVPARSASSARSVTRSISKPLARAFRSRRRSFADVRRRECHVRWSTSTKNASSGGQGRDGSPRRRAIRADAPERAVGIRGGASLVRVGARDPTELATRIALEEDQRGRSVAGFPRYPAAPPTETGRDPGHRKNWLSTVPETGLTTTRSRNGTLDAQIGGTDIEPVAAPRPHRLQEPNNRNPPTESTRRATY